MNEKYTVALRFCGGCNPHFDRAKLYEDIKAEFSAICDFEFYKEGQKYDIALLIDGCSSECLMESDYNAGFVVIHDRNYTDHKSVIQSALDQIKKIEKKL